MFSILEKLKLKRPDGERNWLKLESIRNLLEISGYKVINSGYRIIVPGYFPIISNFLNNKIKKIKFLSSFSVEQYLVAKKEKLSINDNLTCAIIIPTLNRIEEVKKLIPILPNLGKKTEIIIVDGSPDKKMEQTIKKFASEKRSIKYVQANKSQTIDSLIREGINVAESDIIITYDDLMSIPPSELTRFYNLLASGKADFINGIRYVYPIEGQSLRQLNIVGNIIFSSLYSLLLGQRLKDPLSLIKAFYLKDYQNVQISGNDIFLDLLIKVGGQGKIKEIPVHYNSKSYFVYKKKTTSRILGLMNGILGGIWYLKVYLPMKRTLGK